MALFQSLGERWAAVCRWTEERWHKLQEVFVVWQQLLSDQVSSSIFFLKNIKFIMQHFNIVLNALTVSCDISVFFSIPLLQSLFGVWLAEKEEALNDIGKSNFRDPNKMNTNLRHLAVSCLTFPRFYHLIYLILTFLTLL